MLGCRRVIGISERTVTNLTFRYRVGWLLPTTAPMIRSRAYATSPIPASLIGFTGWGLIATTGEIKLLDFPLPCDSTFQIICMMRVYIEHWPMSALNANSLQRS